LPLRRGFLRGAEQDADRGDETNERDEDHATRHGIALLIVRIGGHCSRCRAALHADSTGTRKSSLRFGEDFPAAKGAVARGDDESLDLGQELVAMRAAQPWVAVSRPATQPEAGKENDDPDRPNGSEDDLRPDGVKCLRKVSQQIIAAE